MELLYRLALGLIPNIGDVHARLLIEELGDATSVFRARRGLLEKMEGIGPVRASAIKSFQDFDRVEAELRFIEQYGIRVYFLTDKEYPQRLLHCYDAPILLFYKGVADLNASRILSVVGTRSHTEYGRQATEALIKEIAMEPILIVSGLAYGIDALAHRSAILNGLPTVGVTGHGLDQIYPHQHVPLAKEMIRSGGGILTEFFSGTQPDRHHFPLRNRIVAAISDATVVIETHLKGGSMITAKLADSYHRDVLAFPGRSIDRMSSGCNELIRHNKAILLSNGRQLLDVLGWTKAPSREVQGRLFTELSDLEHQVATLLEERGIAHTNEVQQALGISTSTAANVLLNLEMKSVVQSLPGDKYRLC